MATEVEESRRGEVQDHQEHQVIDEAEQFRNEDLESRLSGGGGSPESQESMESISREEKLLEEMLRLKLTVGGASAMLPPKQRIKLYQPRSKLEQFEDILIESQLLDQAIPDLTGSPLDYDKFELENLNLNGITDFDTSDAIFAEPNLVDSSAVSTDTDKEREGREGSCQCDSCLERSALVAEMAEETKKLQACWLELREDFKTVYRLTLEGAWGDSNRPKPSLDRMTESVHKLVWRDPHQLYQRLESQLRDFVLELKGRLVELLQKQAKNPNLAQEFIQCLLGGHDKLCEAGKLVTPVLSDLEVNHLRRFSLTWELLSKHLYQLIVYTDPLIQNNLPIFISQLRALYPNKENEDKYTELVRGYLDFDVEMENVGVFWSGTEALLLEYSMEQQRLREKQRMLKSDWERFKLQRKQIENSLMEKPQNSGEGEELSEHVPGEEHLLPGDDSSTIQSCECHVCTAPTENGHQECSLPLFPPQPSNPPTPCSSSLYPHLYNLPTTSYSTSTSVPPVISSVASLSAALSSALHLTTSSVSSSVSSITSLPSSTLTLPSTVSTLSSNTSTSPPAISSSSTPSSTPMSSTSSTTTIPTSSASTAMSDNDGIRVTPAPLTPPPSRPKTLSLDGTSVPSSSATSSVTSTQAAEEKKVVTTGAKASVNSKPATTCNHKHNNANAKELKKMMGHDCGKSKSGTRKSKSREDGEGGESTEELSDCDSIEDSCSSSASGDKHCACCYCEVFGHGGPSVAPVSRNYPEMRERLRLLLSKKKRSHRAQQQGTTCPGNGAHHPPAPQSRVPAPPTTSAPPNPNPVPQSQPRTQTANPANTQAQAVQPPPPAPKQPIQQEIRRNPNSTASSSPSPVLGSRPNVQVVQSSQAVKEILAKKDVDEVLEYIEGNKNISNDKKRQKKERQKQQKMEELRAKQEEERRRKSAEESARKAREEEERMKKELEDKAAKKSKKKAAQKAKKLANSGPNESPCPETPDNEPENMLDLENLRLKHIREQKDLLEEQKQQLIEQQRKLDEQLSMKIGERNAANAAVSAAEAAKVSLSKKQAKKAAKAASPAPTSTASAKPQGAVPGAYPGGYNTAPTSYGAPGGAPAGYYPPSQAPPPYYPGYSSGGGAPQPYYQQYQQPQYQQPQIGGFPSFQPQSNPYQPPPPQPSRPTPPPPAPVVKSDQPMVTIKRVMRPDSSEPTVTISVKKDEESKGDSRVPAAQSDKVLFTLVNGQVMKTPNAPDNLIPGAKLMPQELAKRLLPEDTGESKLSKKQKKKLNAAKNKESDTPSPAPFRSTPGVTPQSQVPERRYFPCKEGGPLGEPAPSPSTPWGGPAPPNPYGGGAPPYGSHAPPNFTPSSYGPSAGAPPYGAPGVQYGAPQPPNSNVIVVDTNSLDEKVSKKSKKKKNKAAAEALATSQQQQLQQQQAQIQQQHIQQQQALMQQQQAQMKQPTQSSPWPRAGPGMAGGVAQSTMGSNVPGFPPAQAQPQASAVKPKEWTPAQYGGYVPPKEGGGGGQVLIKSVNGKVVITPVPGTGGPSTTAPTSTPSSTNTTSSAKSKLGTSSTAVPSRNSAPSPATIKRPLAPTTTSKVPTKVIPASQHNGAINGVNGNNNIENQAPTEEMTNGNHAEEEKKNKKNKTKKRNPDEKLEEINSIFAPREAVTGDMDPADREIEQFKQFCLDSRPAQNRAKVSFDVRNIAFKKKN